MGEYNDKKGRKASPQRGSKSFSRLEKPPFGADLRKITPNQDETKQTNAPLKKWKKRDGHDDPRRNYPSHRERLLHSDGVMKEAVSTGNSVIEGEESRFQLGVCQSLRVLRMAPPGAYLDGGFDEILLPNRYLPEECAEGIWVEVFVYHDNEGRLVATTLHPLAQVGEVAFLEVNTVTEHGAFLNWGIHRDLFVPFSEQRVRMQEGLSYPVAVYIDQVSGRIVGSSKLNKHIAQELPSFRSGEAVDVLFVEAVSVGFRAVVNHHYWGMVYTSDLDETIKLGDRTTAYVVRVREDDRLDLSLTPLGMERIEEGAQKLLALLRNRGGELPIGDKSTPEEIEHLTGFSKKVFKRASGVLYKSKLIVIEPFGIKLL